MKSFFKRTITVMLLFCLAVSLSGHAAAYKKSPSGWGGITGPGGSDKPVNAEDAQGGDITSWIIVTPYEERDTLPQHHLEVFERSHDAIDMLQFYESLKQRSLLPEEGELSPMAFRDFVPAEPMRSARSPHDVQLSSMVARLAIKENPDHWTGPEYLNVKHLFYVHEYEDRGLIAPPVSLTLDVGAHEHDFLGFFEYVEDDWQKLTFHDNDDGTITFEVNQWGPFVVLYQALEDPAPAPEVHSPQTGDTSLLPLCMAVVAAAGIPALALVCLRKKRA